MIVLVVAISKCSEKQQKPRMRKLACTAGEADVVKPAQAGWTSSFKGWFVELATHKGKLTGVIQIELAILPTRSCTAAQAALRFRYRQLRMTKRHPSQAFQFKVMIRKS